MAVFRWDKKKSDAAIALANGYTRREVCEEYAIPERTLYNWLSQSEFEAEVDRLSLMVGIAGRGARLRLAQRVMRQRTADDGTLSTKADLLDWLKFAQSETDGVKLDLTRLAAAFSEDATPLAAGGSD